MVSVSQSVSHTLCKCHLCSNIASDDVTCTKPNLVVHIPYTDNDLIISDIYNMKMSEGSFNSDIDEYFFQIYRI